MEDDYDVCGETHNFTYQIDTNSFLNDDFELFVDSLEMTYTKRQFFEKINEDYEYFCPRTPSPREICPNYSESVEDLRFVNQIDQKVDEQSPIREKVELVKKSSPQWDPLKRQSFLNIFNYFDQDVAINLDESILTDEGQSDTQKSKDNVQQSNKTNYIKKSSEFESKFVEKKFNCSHLDAGDKTNESKKNVGKLNKNLLKIFESGVENDDKIDETVHVRDKSKKFGDFSFKANSDKDKSFIDSINELFTTYRQNESENLDKSKPKEDVHKPIVVQERLKSYSELVKALERHESRHFIDYKQSTLKPNQDIDEIMTGSLSSINTNTSEEDIDSGIQSKTLSPNRNEAFFDQKDDSFDLSFSAIDDEDDVSLKISGIFEVSPNDSFQSDVNDAEAHHAKVKDILQANTLVKLQNSSLLFEIDKILNECKLSLIQMILELIDENLFMRNEIEIVTDLKPDYCSFIQAFTLHSYQIDSVKTTSPQENCVAVEILMLNQSVKSFLKVFILFDIRNPAAGPCNSDYLNSLCNECDFKIVVSMNLKVKMNKN